MFTPQKVEKYLAKTGSLWIGAGAAPTSLDKQALEEIEPLEAQMSPEFYPHLFAWYLLAS